MDTHCKDTTTAILASKQGVESQHTNKQNAITDKECRCIIQQIHDNTFNTSEKVDANQAMETRRKIDARPEMFYFLKRDASFTTLYTRNLVSLNSHIIIDDVIYEKLAGLANQNECQNTLFWIYQLLLNRSFSRTTLRHIFNSVVYLDFEGHNSLLFCKYGILAQIIKHYKLGDIRIEKLASEEKTAMFLYSENSTKGDRKDMVDGVVDGMVSEMVDDLKCFKLDPEESTQLILDQFTDEFLDKKDISNDNTQVLANIIWENAIFILEDILKHNLMEESTPADVFELVNFDCLDAYNSNDFEAACILELFSVIIRNTGYFYQNRICKNISLLRKMDKIPSFKAFVDAISENFEPSSNLISKN